MSLFWHQLRAEQLTTWRSREAVIFVFLFPPLLFVLLASVFGDGIEDGRRISSYLVAGLIGYAVANTALGGLAAAPERQLLGAQLVPEEGHVPSSETRSR